MAMRSSAQTVDEYIAEAPEEIRPLLEQMRKIIRSAVPPEATETISYAIPTFDLAGRHLVHFAGFKSHIGFYPTGSGFAAFAEEFAPYKSGKGSVQLPLDQPLPEELLKRVVRYRVEMVLEQTTKKRASDPKPAGDGSAR